MRSIAASLLFTFWPRRAQIEITNRCNLNCRMCPRKRLNLIEKDMPFSTFSMIMDKLSSIKEITLSGWGEPLLHPDLPAMIEYCKRKGKVVKLTTNGLALNDDNIKSLLRVDEIAFSIDRADGKEDYFGHDNKTAFLNIERLRKLKKAEKPFIRIQAIYYQKNRDDIFRIIRFAEEEKLDSVKIMKVNSSYCDDKERVCVDDKELVKLYRDIEEFTKKMRIRVDLLNYSLFTGIKNLLYSLFIKTIPATTRLRCVKVLNFVYVRVDGKVLPTGCGELYDYTVGDLTRDGLDDIWKSEKFLDFRNDHMRFCDPRCSFLITDLR